MSVGNETVCICCGSDQRELLGEYYSKAYRCFKEPYRLNRCRTCDFIYINPRPSPEVLSAFYSSEVAELGQRLALKYTSPKPSVFNGTYTAAVRLLDHIHSIHPIQDDTKLLDVGCGVGFFLFFAQQKRKFIALGNDLGAHAVAYARERYQLDVRHGELKDCLLASESLDVVRMSQVLEHLLDPIGTLAEVRRLLKPGGLLVIEIPCYDTFFSGLFKGNWAPLFHPVHLYQFTPKTITAFLRRAGFEMADKIKVSACPMEVTGSLLNIMDFDYNRVLQDVASASRWKKVKWASVVTLLMPVFILEFLMLQALSRAFDKGAVMTVFVRKPVPAIGSSSPLQRG